MLRVSLIGNLGADSEVRYTQKGAVITSFRVAVNQVRTKPDSDEREESTEWFRVRASGRLGEFTKRLTKGSRVLVFGRLDISHYQRQDGTPQTGFDVWADEVQGIRTGSGGEPQGEAGVVVEPQPARGRANSGVQPRQGGQGAEDLEDLPF